MSLLEAMLLEPVPIQAPTEPIERIIHIALRTDGQLGSGTEADPFHGGTVRAASLAVTTLVRVAGTAPSDPFTSRVDVVTVTTAAPHGLGLGEAVEISGVTGSTPQFYNGQFRVVEVVSSLAFKHEIVTPRHNDTSFQPGTPVLTGATCRKVAYLIDKWLGELPASSVAWIGPGTFETRGNDARDLRHGQKIHGAGTFLTTLKMVPDLQKRNYQPYAFQFLQTSGNYHREAIEVQDLTVDCNQRSYPAGWDIGGAFVQNPYASLAVGGVSLHGPHHRIRRVRVIDFGSQDKTQESFPLAAGQNFRGEPESVNCVIEDCLVELPSRNGAREISTMVINGGGGVTPRGCALRNNVFDGRHADGSRPSLLLLSKIEAVAGRPHEFKVTTNLNAPHGRQVGDMVRIAGIRYGAGEGTKSTALNGAFPVVAVTSDTLTYRVPRLPEEANLDAVPPIPAQDAFADVDYHPSGSANGTVILEEMFGPVAEYGTGMVAEGNRVYYLTSANNHDTWSSRDSIYRGNYYAGVREGHRQYLDRVTDRPAQTNFASLSRSGSQATVVTSADHGLLPGSAVLISEVRVNSGALSVEFNGFFVVESVLTSKQFRFTLKGNTEPQPDAIGSEFPPIPPHAPIWREQFRHRNLVVEGNIIELSESQMANLSSGIAPKGGMKAKFNTAHFPSFWRVLVERNVVRNQEFQPFDAAYGISFVGVERGLVRENVIALQGLNQNLLADREVGQVNPAGVVQGEIKYFNNQDGGGQPLRGMDNNGLPASPAVPHDDLRSKIQDAFLMSL